MKAKGIIFDLDGVIVHTDELHYKAWKAIADKMGIYFDKEINNLLRGVSRMASLDIILDNSGLILSDTEKEVLASEKNEIYKTLLLELTPESISEDVRSTLLKLKEKGIKIAIGSSSKNAMMILEQTKLSHLFDAVSDGNNITRTKPDPEVFLKAAEYLNLDPKDCYVVEDAVAGLEAAKTGGFTAIAIGDATKSELADIKIYKLPNLIT